MVNLLLNIIPYQNNYEKFLTYFSKLCYDVHCRFACAWINKKDKLH